ncbi:neural cell adhesion molecule 2-like [Triplophysa dalaica]|uniref:neural cell adhesion molecule 2-like n=1 Tax=Triplophysa dalaica TaxID=1582913 RepID=UPI0024DF33E2|nr:neural cell adhesion molecule 2-like [Triplophysa dalaica]
MCTFKNILFLVLHILGESADLYRKAGTDLTIQCKGTSPKDDVEWKFKDNRIARIYNGRKLRGSIYPSGSNKYHPDTDSLRITRLESSDSGRYFCSHGSEYNVHVVSAFVQPGTVLPQSSDAELHCNVEGDPKADVTWLRPSDGQEYHERKQKVHLKSLTLKENGQWTCQVQGLQINITLTVVGLQTTEAVEVTVGRNVVLPCSLPQITSRRVVGGKWEADHLPEVSSATLDNTQKTLQWNGQNTSKVIFTNGPLSINYDIKLTKVQSRDAGRFVCTVEFDGGTKLTANTTLTVVTGTSGNKGSSSMNGPTLKWKGPLTKDVLGLQLWIWIAVGASSMLLVVVIIAIVLVQGRNKRMKKRVRQLRSMRQPLTAVDYCHCDRSEREEELVKQVRPGPVPRHQRNINKTKPYN